MEPSPPNVTPTPDTSGDPYGEDAPLALVPASFWVRMIAFGMDYVLIMAATYMIMVQLVYPFFHPGFLEAYKEFVLSQQAAGVVSFQEQMQQVVDFQLAHDRAINDAGFIYAVLVWIYFAMSELFLSGTTLGKKVFKLSLIDLKTLNRPEGKTILLRNCLKSLSVIMPLLFVVNLAFAIFNRFRLSGHDMVSKTMVTYDYVLPPVKTGFSTQQSTD